MGLIIVGILVTGVCLFVVWFAPINDYVAAILLTLGIFCILIVLNAVIGGLGPVSVYEEPQIVSSIELVGLRDDTVSEGTTRRYYISITGTNSYTYYAEVDSPYASSSQKAYKSDTISGCNVTIVEDDSYTEAKLVTYVRYGKNTFWTFAIGAKQYEYVFYVPTGTVAQMYH